MVHETVNYREKSGFKRNDFMQLLIQIRNKGKVDEENEDLEQNGHEIVEYTCGEKGTYVFPMSVICKQIH
jgi:hypothetical protein